jgi:uncharacterized membrane protein
MKLLKKIGLVILIIGYLAAGANHFRAPESYIPIIPTYIPFPKFVNIAAGFFELLFGFMLIFKETRTTAAWGIIILLVLFIPVHVDMVLHAPFHLGKLYVTAPIAWLRLVVLQPLLIVWARWYKVNNN